jgi:hypothetical protein
MGGSLVVRRHGNRIRLRPLGWTIRIKTLILP